MRLRRCKCVLKPAETSVNTQGRAGPRSSGVGFRPRPTPTVRSAVQSGGGGRPRSFPSGPRDAHLELRTEEPEGAAFLAELAAADGFSLGVAERRGHAFAYAKGGEAIADLLAYLGANEAALRLGEEAVVAATRARANRLANADHANLGRASRAAEAQLRAIERLDANGRLAELAPELREIARLRRRHPTVSLRELAARCRPPATKMTAHRRLAKIQKLADV